MFVLVLFTNVERYDLSEIVCVLNIIRVRGGVWHIASVEVVKYGRETGTLGNTTVKWH